MATIKKITREVCGQLSNAIEADLQALAEKHGIQITRGNAKFDDDNMSLQIKVALIGEGGMVMTKEASYFQQVASFIGFEASDLGRSFKRGTTTYTILGYATTNRKNKLLVGKVGTDSQYWVNAEGVPALLEASA